MILKRKALRYLLTKNNQHGAEGYNQSNHEIPCGIGKDGSREKKYNAGGIPAYIWETQSNINWKQQQQKNGVSPLDFPNIWMLSGI